MRAPTLLIALTLSACVGHIGTEGSGIVAHDDDGTPPLLTLDPIGEPFVEGGAVLVSGRVEDLSPVSLTIDGESVALDGDGRFEHRLALEPGAHRVLVEAADTFGGRTRGHVSVIAGRFAATGDVVQDGAAVTLGADAMEELARGASAILSATDFRGPILAQNPIARGDWGKLEIRDVSIGAVEVELAPTAGVLYATVRIRGLHVALRVDLPSPLPNLNGDLRAEVVEAQAGVALEAVDGELVATLVDSSVTLHGFSYNIHDFPGFLEELVRDEVRSRLEHELGAAVGRELPGFLADAVGHLAAEQSFDVDGVALLLTARFEEVSIDGSGLYVRTSTGVHAAEPLPGRDIGPPLLGGLLPPRRAAGLAVDVALDALNAAAFAAWSGGALNRRLSELSFGGGPLTVTQLSLLFPSLSGRGPPGAPVSIDLDFALPPVTMETPGGLVIDAPDVRLALLAATPGGETTLVTLSVGLRAPVTAALGASGEVLLEVGELTVTADPIDAPAGFPRGDALDTLLTDLIREYASDLLDPGGLPIPSLYGFEVDATRLTTEGGYLSFEGTLRYAGG